MKKTKNISIGLMVGLGLAVVIGAVALGLVVRNRQPASPDDTYRPRATETAVPSSAPVSPRTSATPTPTPPPTSSTPPVSSSGVITLASPAQGSTVISGTVVSGKAAGSSPMVYFRLKGTKSGQVASGSVKPTNGAYSFELAFTNQVAGGQDEGVLEVYTVSNTGAETNAVSITVSIRG